MSVLDVFLAAASVLVGLGVFAWCYLWGSYVREVHESTGAYDAREATRLWWAFIIVGGLGFFFGFAGAFALVP